ncbi:unnamed protein product [Musa hybrid cultivar]
MTNNNIHQMKNNGIIIISNKDNDPTTMKSVYHIPSTKKNLFSIANAVDDINFVLFDPNKVKILYNIKELDAHIVYYGKRVKDLHVLSASTTYVDKMSTNDSASIWYARLGHIIFFKLKIMM